MLRTFAVLALGVALIAWGTQFMAKQHSSSRANMLEDLASGVMDAVDNVLPDDDEPAPVAASEELAIAATGGSGVALRDDCLDDARLGGALPEGAAVTRLSTGAGRCTGWSLVLHIGAEPEVQTWVRDEYLGSIEAPASE